MNCTWYRFVYWGRTWYHVYDVSWVYSSSLDVSPLVYWYNSNPKTYTTSITRIIHTDT